MAVQNQRLQQQQQQQNRKEAMPSAIAATATTTINPKLSAMPSTSTHSSNTLPATSSPNQANNNGTGVGGGPRVSFNRDVHVKRIGKHPHELTNYETTNLQPPQNNVPYHQLPADLSAESIRKEAALVLAQAERHKSKADSNGDNIPTFKVRTKRSSNSSIPTTNPKKFHSLPTRKKKAHTKPVARSVSDAAAKKPPKRPSIFSIFSRKSDTNISQVERDPRFEGSGGRRLVRSKSDVGSTYNKDDRKPARKTLKEPKPNVVNGSSKQLSTPLSPIIENAQKEDYFAEQFSRERRKSDAITDREKYESGLDELLVRSREKVEIDGSIIGKNPISKSIKDKILTLQAKSNDNMHSSQMPAQKLPLTKGVTVNGLAKRLSMERFSPPPPLSGPAFSYIRPNEGITYAQLDLSDDQQQGTLHRREYLRTPTREMRTPMREFRSPARDVQSADREIRTSTATLGHRQLIDRADFATSHNNLRNNAYSPNYTAHNGSSSRVIIESPTRMHESFAPLAVGPTTIRISSSHSPSPWQQLSPRNLSDEDEGLGVETRKYYDDDSPAKMRSKSPAEPPIVPVIRSITPTRENGYDAHIGDGYRQDPVDDIGYRRAQLESRILTRRFGESATLDRNGYNHHHSSSPECNREREEVSAHHHHHRYLSPERELYEPRRHKPETTEIIQKYSPERSHLDIIAPTPATRTTITNSNGVPKTEKTSRYKHTKYYDDGRGGVKEVYERETHLDAQGKPRVHESRHRERLDSYSGGGGAEGKQREHQPSIERQHLNLDYEPKSLDSQFTTTDQYRSSPENMKRYELSMERNGTATHQQHQQHQRLNNSEDHWHSSLKRDKLQQRSFDKGDSGIENDFRKESFNGDISTRWRKRTIVDDIKACESFLKKERRHTEQQHVAQRRNDNYIYRERSIDDGSHFDPHLDKYPVATSTLRRKDQHSQTGGDGGGGGGVGFGGGEDTLKRNKKLGGFEKVKQLFTGSGGGSGGGGGAGSSSSSTNTNNKKELQRSQVQRANSTTSSSVQTPPKDKDKYMVKEEEMRSRYSEHRGTLQHGALRGEPKATDISMRRRLSTPKASPLLLKRTSSDKTAKKESPLAKPEKTSWFKSLDRRAKSKSKEKLNVSVNGQSETTSMKRSKTARNTSAPPPIPPKNLRFFGDTDLDSNPPTVSRATTTLKSRPLLPSSTLNRSQKYSQSAYHLDRINANNNPQQQDYRRNMSASQTVGTPSRHKSSSMHNLENGHVGDNDEVDFRKRRHYSRSRDLDDISESGSETEDQHKRSNGTSTARTLSRERLDRSHRYDDSSYRRSSDRSTMPQISPSAPNSATSEMMNGGGGGGGRRTTTTTTTTTTHHHLTGPPKPARSNERRMTSSSYSRERDRFPAESSGTEGESSLHSQRSIVYLHATTVGAIPQPYHLRRRSISRDDLRSNKSKNQNQPLQPMTRTVSRSVSMLAPWKPKLISEGYEINYSQEQNKRMATMPRKPHNGSSSTLTRTSKKSDTPSSRSIHSRRHEQLKDDQSSLRNSSTTSASKSALSSNLRSADGRRKMK